MLRFSKEISLIAICNFLIINSCKIWNLHDIRRFFQLDHCNSILRFFHNGLIPSTYSDAALYYFINKTAFSGMIRFNAKGEYNVPYGRYKNLNTKIITEAHHALLVNTEIHNTDYSDIFNLVNPDDFVFLDPPYDCIFSDYGNIQYQDGFNEENHRRLAEDFYNLGCRSLMVIGDTPLLSLIHI